MLPRRANHALEHCYLWLANFKQTNKGNFPWKREVFQSVCFYDIHPLISTTHLGWKNWYRAKKFSLLYHPTAKQHKVVLSMKEKLWKKVRADALVQLQESSAFAHCMQKNIYCLIKHFTVQVFVWPFVFCSFYFHDFFLLLYSYFWPQGRLLSSRTSIDLLTDH